MVQRWVLVLELHAISNNTTTRVPAVGLGVTHTPSKKMPGGGQLDSVQPETDVKPGAHRHVVPFNPTVNVGEHRNAHVPFCNT